MESKLLGSLEQKIMCILWSAKKPMKPAEVLEELGGTYAYTTIMTELSRMTVKKLLKRKLVGKAYVYSPLCCKKSFVKTRLHKFFGNIVDIYGDLAISQFVDTLKKDPEDLKLLKKYLRKNHE